ncbi:MAG: cell division protein FtsA, partial [Candidatus Omnitrophota bacterium]
YAPIGAAGLDNADKMDAYLTSIHAYVKDKDASTVYITGGGALKENLIELAEQLFQVRCELGHTGLKWCLLDASNSVLHTTTLGIIAYKHKNFMSRAVPLNPVGKAVKFVSGLIDSYF